MVVLLLLTPLVVVVVAAVLWLFSLVEFGRNAVTGRGVVGDVAVMLSFSFHTFVSVSIHSLVSCSTYINRVSLRLVFVFVTMETVSGCIFKAFT